MEANCASRWLITIIISVAVLLEKDNTVKCDDGLLPPLVETQYGPVQGNFYYTEKSRKVYAFLGIPYARPPVGDLRFEPPQAPDPWEGFRNATVHPPDCIQLNHWKISKGESDIVTGEEDCLYLNIYTPYIFNVTKLPVVIYIHGEGFSFGSAKEYEPRYILDKMDVIFITFNYRLGPFGFLGTESYIVPGNMGMKDQIQVMKWVKENIHSFDGNPSRVTLIGNSAGGASVHYHYLSKLSRDLFNHGISMSGTALCPWALMEHGREKAFILGNSLGCSFTNQEDLRLITCLKKKSARDILLNVKELFMPWLYFPFAPFAPTVMVEYPNVPFLDKNPYDIIRKGDAKNAPWMVSVTSGAGLFPGATFLHNDTRFTYLMDNWLKLAPIILDYNTSALPKFHDLISTTIKNQYIDFSHPDIGFVDIPLDLKWLVLSILNDRYYNTYIGMTAKMQSFHYTSNVFFYRFKYRGNHSRTEFYTGHNDDVGVSSGDDLIYTLGSFFPQLGENNEDRHMIDVMLTKWKNFIEFGMPEIHGEGKWDPVVKDNKFGYLNFWSIAQPKNKNMQIIKDFGRQHFWMTLNLDELLFMKRERYYSSSYF